MEDIISKKNLHKYIKNNEFKISHETLEHVINNLKKKNSKLFNSLNSTKVKVGGKITLPSDFFGKDSNNYSNVLSEAPTVVSKPSVLADYTRPPISSNVFPLEGGCGGTCGMIGGCGTTCIGTHKRAECNQKGGCSICQTLFRHSDIKNISKLLNINISKKDYNLVSHHLTNELKNILNKTFNNVKNKDKLIGKSHFNKALKN